MIRYCIIGSGFSGTCMLWHLVNAICHNEKSASLDFSQIEISTIESRANNGLGLPYDMDDISPYHLCNNPADKMALFDNDFVDWMLANREEIIARHPELIHEAHPAIELSQWQPLTQSFYPRALFGIYLSRRFKEACAVAESHGIVVRNYNGYAAVDGASRDGKFNLTIQSRKTGELKNLGDLDKVLLASGHWHAGKPAASNVLSSPYPSKNIYENIFAYQEKNAKKRLTLYVHGMGPSGVDAILSLCGFGHFTYGPDGLATDFQADWSTFKADAVKIIAGSRSGFFPGVRWPLLDYDFQHLNDANIDAIRKNRQGRISLAELMSLVDLELKAASDNVLSFQDLVQPKFDNAKEKLLVDIGGSFLERITYTIILFVRRLRFYQELNSADKQTYDRELDTHFIRTAVPIPLPNAKKLIALINAGVLSTTRLGYRDKLNEHFDVVCEGETVRPDIVICSNGQNYDLKTHPSLLIKNMAETREIIEYSDDGYLAGGICANEVNNYRVVNSIKGYRDYSSNLYSFGPITQYWQNQNNYAAAFVGAAQAVAQDWLAYTLKRAAKR
ncbi:FAD/NAD(P)-binding protein [Janthinobacterium fluminis]|uniref:FAD/NAD(P)-binding protein n=1 Tax=Janthinobacterium fluminis TaxID=2987524 RepID=A0ABT5K3Y3_9BURK|nr:FAD/NAD(P)-binding protein [Janthinobacterium fluminis]MDC8759599.1 FAD/NAD(P)-binding protein [Janthinobacterium fluminis]